MVADSLADGVLMLYRLAASAGTPLVRAHLSRRSRRGKEDPTRHGERLGYPGIDRPSGPLVWLHAASVGESLSALPLIDRIRSGWTALNIVITTGTVTSARLMAERLPTGVVHQYAPVDLPAAVRRFLRHWGPDLAIFVESEFWPNLLTAARARGVETVLVNGRMSAASYAGWRRVTAVMRRLLEGFALILAQSQADQDRLRALGASDPRCVGNLKFAAPPLSADPAELARFRETVGRRPRWLAASTHPGEEEIAATVHAVVAARQPDLLTFIAPRHPHRGRAVAAALRLRGHQVAVRSAGDRLTAGTQIYVADTIGELGLWYRLNEVVFIGGSLIPKGGQNPLEPGKLHCAILCGPHMTNFRQIADDMVAGGGMCRAPDAHALAAMVDDLLEDPEQGRRLAAAAGRYADAQAGVLDNIVSALAPHLDRAVGTG